MVPLVTNNAADSLVHSPHGLNPVPTVAGEAGYATGERQLVLVAAFKRDSGVESGSVRYARHDDRATGPIGEVHAFTVDRVGHDPTQASRLPLVIGVIELEEGPRMTANVVILKYGSDPIKYAPEVRFLGLWLDDMFGFARHLEEVRDRVSKRMKVLKATSGASWGCRRATLRCGSSAAWSRRGRWRRT